MEISEERCPTGIFGFDELIGGGFPRGRTMVVSGGAGTGKTIFGTEFLCRGVEKFNEPGILVLLEQNPEELRKDVSAFNFNLKKFEADGKIAIIDASLSKLGLADAVKPKKGGRQLSPDETHIKSLVDILMSTAKEINARRAVIDSITALDFMMENKRDVRRMMLHINYRLKEANLTTLLLTEKSEYRELMTAGVESYIADGVIAMHYSTFGEDAGRNLTIQKMRATEHSENIHPIKFVRGEGIQVMGV